jgi:hypothetical protein
MRVVLGSARFGKQNFLKKLKKYVDGGSESDTN